MIRIQPRLTLGAKFGSQFLEKRCTFFRGANMASIVSTRYTKESLSEFLAHSALIYLQKAEISEHS